MSEPRPEFKRTLVIAKRGELAWLGHLDLARAVERALRRGALPLRFTEGFHKRIKMRLPEPLPLGVGSEAERYVVSFAQPVTPAAVVAALAGQFPRGIVLRDVVDGSQPEPKDLAVELELESSDLPRLAEALHALAPLLPTIGGAWEIVAPAAASSAGSLAIVRLTPPAGSRVSVGRFLELLRQAVPGGLALGRVHRRVAWQPGAPSLPSCAPFAPA